MAARDMLPDLARRVRSGDRGAVARALTIVERANLDGELHAPAAAEEAGVQALLAGVIRAHVVGITGAPGSGKSTLIGHLAVHLRRQGRKVGILAVDPSSPFSGGAVLGDRLRMGLPADDPGLFMRSLASRGHQGGLALSVFGMVRVLDAAGMDLILVETVGAGQNDVGVLGVAHTVVLVFNPAAGDEVQALKAGIVEIGDVMVVNKSDLPGADEAYRAIMSVLGLSPQAPGLWRPPVLQVSSVRQSGFAELTDAVEQHRRYLDSGPAGAQRRRTQAEWELRAALLAALERRYLGAARESGLWGQLVEQVAQGRIASYQAALRLVGENRPGDPTP